MNAEERRETSRAFSETLRAKWAASHERLRLEDLMGRDRGEEDTALGGQNEPPAKQEGDRG